MAFPITITNIGENLFLKRRYLFRIMFWKLQSMINRPHWADFEGVIMRSTRHYESFCLILENWNWEKRHFSFCLLLEPLITSKVNLFLCSFSYVLGCWVTFCPRHLLTCTSSLFWIPWSWGCVRVEKHCSYFQSFSLCWTRRV